MNVCFEPKIFIERPLEILYLQFALGALCVLDLCLSLLTFLVLLLHHR